MADQKMGVCILLLQYLKHGSKSESRVKLDSILSINADLLMIQRIPQK